MAAILSRLNEIPPHGGQSAPFSLHTIVPASAARVLTYRKTSNISRTLVGNRIVDNSDVVGASPVGAAPTTSSFST